MDGDYYDFQDETEEFDLITLTDSETNESIELVVIDSLELTGRTYLLVIAREEFDEECPNATIVKGWPDESGDYIYVAVEDDDEFEKIAEMFDLQDDIEADENL